VASAHSHRQEPCEPSGVISPTPALCLTTSVVPCRSTRRSSLTADQVYAVSNYILYLNNIVAENTALNALDWEKQTFSLTLEQDVRIQVLVFPRCDEFDRKFRPKYARMRAARLAVDGSWAASTVYNRSIRRIAIEARA
jgi:hypothetical protein